MWTLVTLGNVTGIKGPSCRSAGGKVKFEGDLEAGNPSTRGTVFIQDGILRYCIAYLLFFE